MARILFVDDDEMVRYALGKYLHRAGHDVTAATDGGEALKHVAEQSFDIVVTDIIMPNVEGVELIVQLLKEHPGLPIIAISGGGRVGRQEYLSLAEALGVRATLPKPLDPDTLLELIGQIVVDGEPTEPPD